MFLSLHILYGLQIIFLQGKELIIIVCVLHSVESMHMAGRGHSFEGRMQLQVGNVLVKARITGRSMKQRALCKFQPTCLPLQIHDIPKTLTTLKNLQESSCQHFSLLFLVHLAFVLCEICVFKIKPGTLHLVRLFLV